MNWTERRTCPLLWCRKVFDSQEQMLEHVYCCVRLPDGEYWCHEHQAAERFTSIGMSHLLKILPSPTQLCKRMHSKVHEKAFLTKTKRVLQNLGSKRLHKSTCSSAPSQPYSTMPPERCELDGAEWHPIPELCGDELPAAELEAVERFAESMGRRPCADIPHEPGNNSWLTGKGFRHSSPPSSEISTISLEPATTVSDASRVISTSTLLPEYYSGLHALPSVDCWPTRFDTRQESSHLVSPVSPVSQISSPSTCSHEKSSTIDTSADPNSRRLSDHDSFHPISPLDSDEGVCSTYRSTRPLPHFSTVSGQPANEHIVEASGSYSARAPVPAWVYSVPKRRPLTPKQLDGVIAAKESYPPPITGLHSRATAEYADPMEDLLQHSLPLRGEDCTVSNSRSICTSDISLLTLNIMPSSDVPITTAEVHQGNFTSHGEILSTVHHGRHDDKILLESTTFAHGQNTVTSIVTFIVTHTKRRLSVGKLPTLFDVVIDLISSAQVRRSCCASSITLLTVYRHTFTE